MKKLFCILGMIIAVTLCGCGQAAQECGTAEEEYNVFSETADIHIVAEIEPGDEYTAAEINAQWNGGKIRAEGEIKLRGNSSRESEKKSYTVKFKEEMALMDMDPGKKWALVSDPFDKSLLRPAVGFIYGQELGLKYSSDLRICNVWLNGRYMGVYMVIEPVEAGSGRVEIEPDNGDFLLERNVNRYEKGTYYINSPAGMRFEFNEPEEPSEQQQKMCYELLDAAETAIFTCDHNEYEQYIDVQSFVDFYIFNEMIKDVDFGEYSTRYYFKDGILYAGPPWDLDLTQGNVSPYKEEYKFAEYNNAAGAGDDSGDSTRGLWVNGGDYYYWLCRDPWFNELTAQRWYAVRDITENLAVHNELGDSVLDLLTSAHGMSMEKNFSAAGWSINEPENVSEWQDPAETYTENVDLLRIWLIKRANYLDTQLNSENFVNFR